MPVQASDQEIEQDEHTIDYLLDLGHLDEAAGYIRERLTATASPADRTWLLSRLAEIQLRRGATAESLHLLDIAASLAPTPDQREDVEDLRADLIDDIEDAGLPRPEPTSTLPDTATVVAEDREASDLADSAEPVLVSTSFYELDLKQAMLDLSLDAGVPIVWDREVEGLVTFEAIDMPLEDVLEAILGPNGYSFSRIGGIYYVGSGHPQGSAFSRLSQTIVMPLSNMAADEAVSLLSGHFRPYVNATTQSNNLVCITAPRAMAERIRRDLELIDQPAPQVMIEILVAEVRTDYLRAHGIDWLAAKTGDPSSWSVGTGLAQNLAASIGGELETTSEVLGSVVDLDAGLRALVSEGVAEIRASPRVTTLNGRPAQIGISQDQYYVISDPGNQSTYSYSRIEAVKASIAVQITPFVGPDRMLTLTVQPQVGDVVGEGEEGLPVIYTRSASTTIRVRDGQTFSIGGLNTTKVMKRSRKIPILGHIPLLGLLFRYDEKQEIESELIIFVTPHVLAT